MTMYLMREFARTSLRLRLRSAEFIKDIIDDLNKEGKNATGTLAKSLRFSQAVTSGMITVNFKAKDYWKWVDKGRRPGKQPPIKPLIRWAKVKLGLSGNDAVSAAFAISKTIARKGTKGINTFTNNINKYKQDIDKLRNKELKQDVSEFIRKALR